MPGPWQCPALVGALAALGVRGSWPSPQRRSAANKKRQIKWTAWAAWGTKRLRAFFSTPPTEVQWENKTTDQGLSRPSRAGVPILLRLAKR